MKKIFVLCPGNAVSGGPELLHQFVDSLNNQGGDAYILYYPFETTYHTPSEYEKYNIQVAKFCDVADDIVVLSEVSTKFSNFFPLSEIHIWWASVDFYLGVNRESVFLDLLRNLRSRLFRRVSIKSMLSFTHWHQSEYAKQFLDKYNIKAISLGDYLGDMHLYQHQKISKKNVIAYNPKKGVKRTNRLIQSYSDFTFIPIENMNSEQVKTLLNTSKLYIDFGQHPWKDRLPREAALAGCCIVTGSHGSAQNPIDIPIPDKYKLDDLSNKYLEDFPLLVEDIFENYEKLTGDFDNYRNIIKSEKQKFDADVRNFLQINEVIKC